MYEPEPIGILRDIANNADPAKSATPEEIQHALASGKFIGAADVRASCFGGFFEEDPEVAANYNPDALVGEIIAKSGGLAMPYLYTVNIDGYNAMLLTDRILAIDQKPITATDEQKVRQFVSQIGGRGFDQVESQAKKLVQVSGQSEAQTEPNNRFHAYASKSQQVAEEIGVVSSKQLLNGNKEFSNKLYRAFWKKMGYDVRQLATENNIEEEDVANLEYAAYDAVDGNDSGAVLRLERTQQDLAAVGYEEVVEHFMNEILGEAEESSQIESQAKKLVEIALNRARQILSEVVGAPQQAPGPQRQWRDQLKVSDPKLYAFLLAASHEAYANTGDASGEYGTLHSISELPPGQRQAGIEKALVYKTITDMGPDVSWERMAPMIRKVRMALGGMSIIDAWKKKKLGNILDRAGAFGPKSDTMRHHGDKYY